MVEHSSNSSELEPLTLPKDTPLSHFKTLKLLKNKDICRVELVSHEVGQLVMKSYDRQAV